MRTALLPRELVNKRGRTIQVRVGLPISAKRLQYCAQALEPTEYLAWRVQQLETDRNFPTLKLLIAFPSSAKIATESDPARLAMEVEALPEQDRLITNGDWQVLCTTGEKIPNILREIGRLREISFRAEGEGSGKSFDLDRFDTHYQHLFLWHAGKRQIAGAYLLAVTSDVVTTRRGKLQTHAPGYYICSNNPQRPMIVRVR